MADLNNIVLTGRLTKDIELKKTQSGLSVCEFSIACNGMKDASGTQHTDFIRCTAWRGNADYLDKYARKGTMLSLVGRLNVTQNETSDHEKKTYTNVVCSQLSIIKDGRYDSTQNQQQPVFATQETQAAQQNQNNNYYYQAPQQEQQDYSEQANAISPDDLPF